MVKQSEKSSGAGDLASSRNDAPALSKGIFFIETPAFVDISLILRGLFSLSVLYWHVTGYSRPIPDLLNIPGRVAVWVFFCLSGYVIGRGFFVERYSTHMDALSTYALRRASRIAPLFLLLSGLAIGILLVRHQPIPFGWVEIPAQFLAVQWQHEYRLVGVFWTLGVEVQFYVLAPLLAIWLRRSRCWLTVVTLLWLAATAFPVVSNYLLRTSLDDRSIMGGMPHFLIGMIAAKLASSKNFRTSVSNTYFVCIATIVGSLALLAANTIYNRETPTFWNLRGTILVDLFCILLISVHIGVEFRRIPRNLFSSVLMISGVLSYGIYAWHGLLLDYFAFFQTSLLWTLLATVGLAYLSFITLERPIIAMARAFAPTATRRELAVEIGPLSKDHLA